MGISINGGTPIAGWFFVMENPIKMDDYQYDWGNNHPASSSIIQHHPASSSIIQHHPASSSIIQLLTGYRLGTLWF